MHSTLVRLKEIAKEKLGIETPSELARALNESPQTVKHWETRGVSKKALIKAQELFGVSASWLENGTGDPEPGAPRMAAQAPPAGWLSPDDVAELVRLFAGCDEAGRASVLELARAQFDESGASNSSPSNKRQRRR